MTTRLYDAGAVALGVYARARFRLRVVGERFRPDRHTLIVSSHRSDDDVPVIAAALYRQAHGLWRRNSRLHFAVRDDLFLPGFFAGYPPHLPGLVRRVLFPLDVGPVLRSHLPCHPIRSATKLRLFEYLRDHPDERLDALLPPELAGLFPGAARARDTLRGRHARALWTAVEPGDLDGPHAERSWARRRTGARDDFRELIEVIRVGEPLVIFPEGRPSPDGSIGPVLGGVDALVRRGRPRAVVPIALAYDPLAAGRVQALVGVGAPVDPGGDVLELLRGTTPLTVGESVAAALADGVDAYLRLADDVEAAREAGRPHEPELRDTAVRNARVRSALRRAAAHRDLDRLVLAYRSARA